MTETLRNEGNVWQGLLLCWGINFVLAFVGCSVAWAEAERPGGSDALVNAAILMALSVGLLQLLYVIPLCRVLKKNGKTRTLKGVTIAAWTTALLNATWVMFKAAQNIR